MTYQSLVRRSFWVGIALLLSSWTTSSFADELLGELEGMNSFERPPSSSPSTSSSSSSSATASSSSLSSSSSSSCSICADGAPMEEEYENQVPFRDHPGITCWQLDLMLDTGTPCDVIQVAAAARCGCAATPQEVKCPLCQDYSLPPHLTQGLTSDEDYATCFDLLVLAAAAPTSNTDCFAVQRLGVDLCGCPTAPHHVSPGAAPSSSSSSSRDNHHRPDYSDENDNEEQEALQLSVGAIVGIAMVLGVLVGIVVLCLCSPQCNVMAREDWSSPLELPPDLESSQLSLHLAHASRKLGEEGPVETDPPLLPSSSNKTDATLPDKRSDDEHAKGQPQQPPPSRFKKDHGIDEFTDPAERPLPAVT